MSVPDNASLHPPYPNPFNGETVFQLDLESDAEVIVSIYNIRGELISSLVRGQMSAGSHRLTWDGRDVSNKPASSGLYFIRAVISGKSVFQQKVMFVR